MDKTFIFDDGLYIDNITKLIKDIEDNTTKEDNIFLYISSGGGHTNATDVLINYINGKGNITLLANGQIQSCAFTLLAKTYCEKYILDTCWGMAHLCYSNISKRNKKLRYKIKRKLYHLMNKPYSDDFHLENLDRENNMYTDLYKEAGVPKDKIERMLKGEDVYFSNQEMKNLFNT